jgi:hypothetical protein
MLVYRQRAVIASHPVRATRGRMTGSAKQSSAMARTPDRFGRYGLAMTEGAPRYA